MQRAIVAVWPVSAPVEFDEDKKLNALQRNYYRVWDKVKRAPFPSAIDRMEGKIFCALRLRAEDLK